MNRLKRTHPLHRFPFFCGRFQAIRGGVSQSLPLEIRMIAPGAAQHSHQRLKPPLSQGRSKETGQRTGVLRVVGCWCCRCNIPASATVLTVNHIRF